jgi:hypothetical protein
MTPKPARTHVAATFDGTTTTLYINGVTVGSETSTGARWVTAMNPIMQVGQFQTNLAIDRYFDGRIDEMCCL